MKCRPEYICALLGSLFLLAIVTFAGPEITTPWQTTQIKCECRNWKALGFGWHKHCECEDGIQILQDFGTRNLKEVK